MPGAIFMGGAEKEKSDSNLKRRAISSPRDNEASKESGGGSKAPPPRHIRRQRVLAQRKGGDEKWDADAKMHEVQRGAEVMLSDMMSDVGNDRETASPCTNYALVAANEPTTRKRRQQSSDHEDDDGEDGSAEEREEDDGEGGGMASKSLCKKRKMVCNCCNKDSFMPDPVFEGETIRFSLVQLCKYCHILHKKLMGGKTFKQFTNWGQENPDKVQRYCSVIVNLLKTLKGRVSPAAMAAALPEWKRVEVLRTIEYIEVSMFRQFVPVAAWLARPENNGLTLSQMARETVQ